MINEDPPTTLASDRERDEVVRALVHHHVDGRLTESEFEERTERAVAARTRGELRAVLVDLPSLEEARRARRPGAGRPWPRLGLPAAVPIAAFAIAVLVVSHGRAAFGFVWLFVIVTALRARGRSRWAACPPR